MTLNGVMAHTSRYFTEFVYDVVVKKFTFAVSSPDEILVLFIMAAICNRAGHYNFALCPFYLSIFYLFSSPNLSGRRLDVYHTFTHGVALVRI